jgi:hypothetical protein
MIEIIIIFIYSSFFHGREISFIYSMDLFILECSGDGCGISRMRELIGCRWLLDSMVINRCFITIVLVDDGVTILRLSL